MPLFEQGNLATVSEKAERITKKLNEYVEKGYKIVSPIPSCTLMLKQEWPSLLPKDPIVENVAKNTFEITEFVVHLSNNGEFNKKDLKRMKQPVVLHHACHARAQNMGFKAFQMLGLIPKSKLNILQIEKCSGHGGIFGVKKDGFEIAGKVGKGVVQQANRFMKKKQTEDIIISSECPLAADHITQKLFPDDYNNTMQTKSLHPIEILAKCYKKKKKAKN